MGALFIFGLGYTASRIAKAARAMGWQVDATGSAGNIAFDDRGSVGVAIAQATHILSSVPPVADGDPVLEAYGDMLQDQWLGYLSSTGVYGDTGGAWVDEGAAVMGRRASRNDADIAWQQKNARVFRLPGIYGPGRSALERVAAGQGHRVALKDQIFSRIHVDDIVGATLRGFDAPAGIYNLADDHPCSQNDVVEYAAKLLRIEPPPFVELDQLSPASRSFYAENRRVANGKAKRVLGWAPIYPDFRAGLRALKATSSPESAMTPPAAASADQR
jgi:nucleoside-diphosphate-sugar epimerase